jgi:hypothetical protein
MNQPMHGEQTQAPGHSDGQAFNEPALAQDPQALLSEEDYTHAHAVCVDSA